MTLLTFHRTVTVEASPDGTSRTITGIAVPWETPATVASGQEVIFQRDSLPTSGDAPKLLGGHDMSKPLGIVTSRTSTPEAMLFTARISQTLAGDEALVLAQDGVLDAVSVGVEPIDFKFEGTTLIVSKGRWVELSMVPVGAFPEARIASVTAAAAETTPEEPEAPDEEDKMDDNNTEALTSIGAELLPATLRFNNTPAKLPTAAEWIAARYAGGEKWATIQAANQTTADSPGLLPEPILGPVYDEMRYMRPVCEALGVRGMPLQSGKTFSRPYIQQPAVVGLQADELDTLSSQAMIVASLPVTRQTVGGFVTLSEQDVDLTDPNAATLVLQSLADRYALYTETLACNAVIDSAGDSIEITDWTDAAEVVAAVWAARTAISQSNWLPTHIFASPDRVATLGTLASSGGDLLFPNLNPSNALGSLAVNSSNGQPFGLTLVESASFTEGTLIVGNPRGTELYENRRGSVSVLVPEILGVTIAFRGYFSTLVIDESKSVALVSAA